MTTFGSMARSPFAAIALVLLGLAGAAEAQTPDQDESQALAAAAEEAKKRDAAAEVENRREFAGLDLGVGISATFDFGGLERINDAEVVAGVVRVTDEDDVRARIMLESHYFFTGASGPFGVAAEDWGWGPFVAIQPGTDEIIEAAALGVMVGFRQKGSARSFNIGLGVAVDPNVQTLGEGVERDMPLPAGETVVRFREEAQYGLVLIFSQSF
ncbi:MAG: hypothetical protein KJ916_04640 [Alphaproteobacteria bacterium]|nr:hypothetical protein [Alphaproteobacteria bacterium]